MLRSCAELDVMMPMAQKSACVCRYGNTSSGSLWYALSYIESCQRVKRGDTVWQVSLAAPGLRTHQSLSCHLSLARAQQERRRPAMHHAVGQFLGSCMSQV